MSSAKEKSHEKLKQQKLNYHDEYFSPAESYREILWYYELSITPCMVCKIQCYCIEQTKVDWLTLP